MNDPLIAAALHMLTYASQAWPWSFFLCRQHVTCNVSPARYSFQAFIGMSRSVGGLHFLYSEAADCSASLAEDCHSGLSIWLFRMCVGAGMHVLDVCPNAFKHLPGWEQAVAERNMVRTPCLL